MGENNILISCRNISKKFGENLALNDVSLDIRKGEIHALIGENGAGKSTLLKILSGAYTLDTGEIYMNGEKIYIKDAMDARRKGISIIYQELALVNELNAVENLFLGDLLKDKHGLVDWKSMKKKAAEIFKSLEMDIDLDVPVRDLSISQCQMIEVSRALINNSKVIIFDEPTSSLSEKEVRHLFNLIADLKAKGVSILYVSHRLEELFEICETVTVLKDGTKTGQYKISDITKADLISAMVGRELGDYYPKHDYNPGPVALSVENLSVPGKFRDVSFEVRKGEILGFYGLIGAGRSEVMHGIFGAYNNVTGTVMKDGRPLVIKSPKKAIEQGIGLVPEDRRKQGLVISHSIKENIPRANPKSIVGKNHLISSKKENQLAEMYKEKLKIAALNIEIPVGSLSGGNQQKVVIANWLNMDADVYIFDEPTRGIDIGAKVEIYNIMVELADKGKAIIVISSELPEIIGISDRIIVMREGEIRGALSKEELSEENIMKYAIGGN